MGRINKTNKPNPVGTDQFLIYDSEDTSDDKSITLEQASQYTIDNVSALSGGQILTDNNLTNTLKSHYDTAYTNNHTHSNKSVLDNVTGSGDGSLFLNNSGNYTAPNVSTIATCSTASYASEKDVIISGYNEVNGAGFGLFITNGNDCLPIYGRDLQTTFASGNANDDFGLYTVTTYGSPTYTGNKFNSNGATGLSYPISSLGVGSWSIRTIFRSTNSSTLQMLFRGANNYSIQLSKTSGNKLSLWISGNNSSWNIADGTTPQGTKSDWSTSTDYYIRLRFTGTQYLVDWSTDGSSWTNDITVNSTSVAYPVLALLFGIWYDGASYPLIGTMDDLYVSIGYDTIQPKTNGVSVKVNSGTARPIYSEDGTICSHTNPALFPAGSLVRLTYSSSLSGYVFENRVVKSYTNGPTWYRQWSDGRIRQGGNAGTAYTPSVALTFPKSFINTSYSILTSVKATNTSSATFSVVESNTVPRTQSSITLTYVGTGSVTVGDTYWQAEGF